MQSCHALFVVEGATDAALLRAYLEGAYGAQLHGDGKLQFTNPAGQQQPTTQLPGQQRTTIRGKFTLGDTETGIIDAGGKGGATVAIETIVELLSVDLLPALRVEALILDRDIRTASSMHRSFIQRTQAQARRHRIDCTVEEQSPAWVKVASRDLFHMLIGDPINAAGGAVEDHILHFLETQPTRDPTALAALVSTHLGKPLTPKQRVLLSMLRDDYLGSPTGFYERVLKNADPEQLRDLGRTLGIDRVLRVLEDAPAG